MNEYNHSSLYPYLVTSIGDTFPICTVGGLLNDVLYQPKYAEEVVKLLVLVDHLGLFVWVGGPTVGAMADTRIFQECGPKEFNDGEAILMDGGFQGRQHCFQTLA